MICCSSHIQATFVRINNNFHDIWKYIITVLLSDVQYLIQVVLFNSTSFCFILFSHWSMHCISFQGYINLNHSSISIKGYHVPTKGTVQLVRVYFTTFIDISSLFPVFAWGQYSTIIICYYLLFCTFRLYSILTKLLLRCLWCCMTSVICHRRLRHF